MADYKENTDKFIDKCMGDLKRKMSDMIEKYHLNEFTSYKFDQTKGELIFSYAIRGHLECSIQVVGTYSEQSDTWLWAWDGPWVVDELALDSKVAKAYDEQHQLDKLTKSKWDADESDGWAMSAIVAKLASAIGVYRLPNRQSMIFMVIKSIKNQPL